MNRIIFAFMARVIHSTHKAAIACRWVWYMSDLFKYNWRDHYYLKRVFCALILILSVSTSFGQELTIRETEDALKNLYGIEKLHALNKLTRFYRVANIRKAMRYGRQATNLGENILIENDSSLTTPDLTPLIKAYVHLGQVYFDRENYFESQEQFMAAQTLADQTDNATYSNEINRYLEDIEALAEQGKVKQSFLSKTLGDLNVGALVSDASKDVAIQSEIKLGQANERKGEFRKAIEYYENAINRLRDKGDQEEINNLQLKIAALLDRINQHEEAQDFLDNAIAELEEEEQLTTPIPSLDTTRLLPLKEVQVNIQQEKKNLKDLADSYAKEKDFEKSLAYYKLYQELSLKMEADSLQQSAEQSQKVREILLLKQQKRIAELNIEAVELENEKQVRLRNQFILIAGIILLGTIVTLYFYLQKRRQHKQLVIAYRDLNKTKGKLVNAEQKIIKLLRQQVSGDVAQELLSEGSTKDGERRFVCIMFLDIRDFTPMAERLSPEELIHYQNEVFGFMIDVVQQHRGNINQLLGDGFMATFGAPLSHGNDCQNAFLAAKEILEEVKERSDAGIIPKTKIGIGLHAGLVVTGNVGNEARKQYSVTGNPVIIASRIEQLNKTYKSQLLISEAVYDKLEKPLPVDIPFMEVDVKGRSNPVKIMKIA
ncbi:MAG: hypothetical protein HKN87_20020 [Saprospiraceae bacterium]|nr:hypothetical protein [Saprospiraceae bacterium]